MTTSDRPTPSTVASRLLAPWLDERIIARLEGLLVVDKPAGCAVHGEPGDLVTRLSVGLGASSHLGVHQRLDKGASGVMALASDAALGRRLAQAIEAHDLERRYVAVVRGPLDDVGTFSDRLATDEGGPTRVVDRGGKLAVSHYRVLRRVGERALVELSTETGRRHQLRVQLAHRGSPICGDAVYGGEWAPRLMLHATRLGLPFVPQPLDAPRPAAFDDWLEVGALRLGGAPRLERALRDAASQRWPLLGATEAMRIVDGDADDLPGVVVELFGTHAVLAARTAEAAEAALRLASALGEAGVAGVYLKRQDRGDRRHVDEGFAAPAEPVWGSPAQEPLCVVERVGRFAVRLGDGHLTGLFLDQRENRRLVSELAVGRRVLNLFCYTGAFTVAAALGGAAQTVSVDLSKRAIGRARENLELNGVAGEHRLVADDVLRWLPRAARRGTVFDLVVLDPPSFGTRGKRTFSVARDYASLAAGAMGLLAPGGALLAVTNHLGTSPDRFRKILHDASRAAGRAVAQMRSLPSPVDFPNRPDGRLPTKSVLVTVS